MGQTSGNTSGEIPLPTGTSANPWARLIQGGLKGTGKGLNAYSEQQGALDAPRGSSPIIPAQQPQLPGEFWKMFYGG